MKESLEIYDNFLDQRNFENIKNTILGENFPWFFNTFINSPEENNEYFQFTHLFFIKTMVMSNFYNVLMPLFDKMDIQSLVKCKANLNVKQNQNKIYGMHKDLENFSFNSKTAIFYLNENNGYTKLEDGTKIYPKENRLIVFDNETMHSGSSCTDKKARYVININYL